MAAVVACIICQRRGDQSAVALGAHCLCQTCQPRVSKWVAASTAQQRAAIWRMRAERAPFERLSQLPDVTMELQQLGDSREIVEGLSPAETLRMIEVWLKLGWIDEALCSAARVGIAARDDAKSRAKAFEVLFDPRFLLEDGAEKLRARLYPA